MKDSEDFEDYDDLELEFEDSDILQTAYETTYLILTEKISVQEVLTNALEDDKMIFLPFDPFEPSTIPLIIDDVIQYFEDNEEYEKCAELIEIKKDL